MSEKEFKIIENLENKGSLVSLTRHREILQKFSKRFFGADTRAYLFLSGIGIKKDLYYNHDEFKKEETYDLYRLGTGAADLRAFTTSFLITNAYIYYSNIESINSIEDLFNIELNQITLITQLAAASAIDYLDQEIAWTENKDFPAEFKSFLINTNLD